jgi:hypothetical protein
MNLRPVGAEMYTDGPTGRQGDDEADSRCFADLPKLVKYREFPG